MGFEIKLIKLIESHPAIWNRDNFEYREKQIKNKSWAMVAQALGFSENSCRKRWKTIRDRYVIETKAIKKREKNGETGGGSDWQYYEHLSFLSEFVCQKEPGTRPRSKTQPKKISEVSSYSFYDESSSASVSAPVEKKLKVSEGIDDPLVEDEPTEQFEILGEPENVSKPEEKDSDPYVEAIAEIFKLIPENKRISFRLNALNYIYTKFTELNQ